MFRKVLIVVVAGALGAGASVAIGACGEDREGDVQIEGGTTGTGGASTGGATTGGTTTGGATTGGATTGTTP